MCPLPYLILKKTIVEADWKLRFPEKNNGRKHVATSIRLTERPAVEPLWKHGDCTDKAPVLVTGPGGIEVATFNQMAAQDCHLHHVATEIYTVLEGTMKIRIAEKDDAVVLMAGDEILVLPGTAHEVLRTTEFLTRVHSIGCYGDDDKYIRKGGDGEWCQVTTLKTLAKANSCQGDGKSA